MDLVQAGRDPGAYGLEAAHLIKYGASPRATIYLTLAAKASALLEGRLYVIPSDVTGIAFDVLRHRLVPSYEAEAEGLSSDDIIKMIIDGIPTP